MRAASGAANAWSAAPPCTCGRGRKQRWLLLLCGFAALVYAVLGYLVLVTPVTELHEILPVALANVFRRPPVRHACSPCGCTPSFPATGAVRDYCLPDAELTFLSSLDVPLQPSASASAASVARSFLRDKLGTEACYATARSMHAAVAGGAGGAPGPHPSARGHVLWHLFTRGDLRGDMTKAQLDMVAAWLGSQDVHRSTLLVWTVVGYSPPPSLSAYARLLPGTIRWRALDVEWEAEGTPLARSYLLHLRDEKAWADSDIARLVILWKYGGVWMDMDMLFTRSLTPLLGLQFATEFSCDHGQSGFNNAIMRFFPRGRAITALAHTAQRKWPRLRQWTFGPSVLTTAYDAGEPFVRLPWCFFHGRWCDGALQDGSLQRDTPWPAYMLEDAWGLHLHGAGSNGLPVYNASILGVYEGVSHAALLARVEEERGRPAAKEWEQARAGLLLFPDGYASAWSTDTT